MKRLMLVSATFLLFASGLPAAPSAYSGEEILKMSGTTGGLVVHLGCGDGTVTVALSPSERFLVHGLDEGPVDQAREEIASRGLSGRISVETWKETFLPYADNLVNLLVVTRPMEIPREEMLRVMAPGGVICTRIPSAYARETVPRPEEIDEWTHFLRDATNNAVSADTRVDLPRHLQWTAAPQWGRSHEHMAGVSAVATSGGRIFSIIDEGPVASVNQPARWILVARDAFNGLLLWKKKIPIWETQMRGFRTGPAHLPRRLVAVGDEVYVTLGYGAPVVALEAATGNLLRTYEGTDGAEEIVVEGDRLYAVHGEVDAAELKKAMEENRPSSDLHDKILTAFDRRTGETAWSVSGERTYDLMPVTLTILNGRIFHQTTKSIFCLD